MWRPRKATPPFSRGYRVCFSLPWQPRGWGFGTIKSQYAAGLTFQNNMRMILLTLTLGLGYLSLQNYHTYSAQHKAQQHIALRLADCMISPGLSEKQNQKTITFSSSWAQNHPAFMCWDSCGLCLLKLLAWQVLKVARWQVTPQRLQPIARWQVTPQRLQPNNGTFPVGK